MVFLILQILFLFLDLAWAQALQGGSHSPALRTGYDGLRRLCGIPTLPALCDPSCSRDVIFMCGYIQYSYSMVSMCLIAYCVLALV